MAISTLQSTQFRWLTSASTQSATVTPSTQLAGSDILLGIMLAASGVTVSTITDNVANVFVRIATSTEATAPRAELWHAHQISSGSTRISVALSGNSSGAVIRAEYAGLSTSGFLLSTGNEYNGTPSTEHFFAQLTPSENNALVAAIYAVPQSTYSPITAGADNTFFPTTPLQRAVGVQSIQTVASTATGYWRTNAATATGALLHGVAWAVFSDTFVVAAGGGTIRPFRLGLMGMH